MDKFKKIILGGVASILIASPLFLLAGQAYAAWWSPSTWTKTNTTKPETIKVEKPPEVNQMKPAVTPAKVVPIKKVTPAAKAVPAKKTPTKTVPVKKVTPVTKATPAKKMPAKVAPVKKATTSVSNQKKSTVISKTLAAVLTNEEIIDKVKPAIVYIETSYGSGSGMIIESNGLVLTNAHVVNDVNQADVRLSDGRSILATVVGRDENIDLALLQISVQGLPTISLGNSDNVKQGNNVFAFGFPFGYADDVSFKEGTISRRINSEGTVYLETSVELHPGNSGGALVDKFGLVIGVNTKIVGEAIKGVMLGESIKLAIPINVAKSLIPRLKAGLNILDAKVLAQKEAEARAQEQARQAEIERQAQIRKETLAIQEQVRQMEIERQAQAQREARAQEQARQAEIERQAQAQREAQQQIEALKAETARKEAFLAQYNTECTDPINELKQKAIQLKADYYKKVEGINNQPIPMALINGQINRLTNDTNMQINKINNEIQQKALECSIKYGGN